jgi:hypothetical protein
MQRSLAVGLVSFLLGGVVTVGALIALTGTRDPGSPECRSAFTASSEAHPCVAQGGAYLRR